MRNVVDASAPPSSRLINYREFKGKRPTAKERAYLFNGNPLFLRRVAELAQASLSTQTPYTQTSTPSSVVPKAHVNGT